LYPHLEKKGVSEMKRIATALALALVAVLSFPSTAMAGGMLEGKVVFGQDFTLASGETLYGDLLVLGGNARLEPESHITGDVALLGGNVQSSGEIDGDIVLLGGNLDLRAQAVVHGDVMLLGGNIQQEEGALIEGETVSWSDYNIPFDFHWGDLRVLPIRFGLFSAPVKILLYFFRSFMMAALAVLVVMFWPEPTKRVGQATVGQALISAGIGLLTVIVAPLVLLVLVITIIGIPVAAIVTLALIVAAIYGWIGLGLEVGRRLAEVSKWDLHPAAAAGLGTFIFSLVVNGIGFIPCVGWLAPFIVVLLSIGAVILTRFGTQAYSLKKTTPSKPEVIEAEAAAIEETEDK
jgi:hypothetical protein